MCSDRLFEMHEVIKEPLRQKILLKLGQHTSQDFDELFKSLKVTDSFELSNQLNILQEMKVEGEILVSKQKTAYTLTEKGHEVLTKIITFPEIATDSYREKLLGESEQSKQSKPKPKWFTPYWFVLFASTLILGVVILPIFGNQSLDKAIVYTVIALMILGFGYYVRVKPSITVNKFVYIVILGSFVGCLLWFIGLFIAMASFPRPHTEATDNILFVVLTTLSFAIGPIVGYFIGKARNFKGPEQYSP
jgi:DNA-binding HxlR family transcriptional regulator